MDSIIWAFKHSMRDIGDMGLSICLELLTNISRSDPSVYNGFYQTYLLSLLQDVFFVLTDTDHKSGFKIQCMTLAHIFYVVNSGLASAPLFDPAAVGSNPNMNNVTYLRDYVSNLLHNAFPHLQRYEYDIWLQ
jgi:exportin-1